MSGALCQPRAFLDSADCIKLLEDRVSCGEVTLLCCVSEGAQLHHLTQVGLSSRMNGYPAGSRAAPGQNGGLAWNHYHSDDFSRPEAEKEAVSGSEMVYFLAF